jgi:hypothetical protein
VIGLCVQLDRFVADAIALTPGFVGHAVPPRPTDVPASVTKIDAGDVGASADRLNAIAFTGTPQPAVGDIVVLT